MMMIRDERLLLWFSSLRDAVAEPADIKDVRVGDLYPKAPYPQRISVLIMRLILLFTDANYMFKLHGIK